MKTGTKSILFGAHQFFLHPIFLALAWRRLYGFPWDPRLWIAFIVHDLGYWGKSNMDGPEGNRHVELGGKIMRIFGEHWSQLCLYHSRFYAKEHGAPFSRLCVADKLSITMIPKRLYLPLVRLTGEIEEYMALAKARTQDGEPKYASMKVSTNDEERWFNDVQEYLRRWVEEHKNGGPDTWTPILKRRSRELQ